MSRLIIKNLPPKTNEDKLRQSFSSFGNITDIQLKYTKDGKFRNFAFVGYKSENEAESAQKHFNKSYFGASKIQVEICADLGDFEKKPRAWSKYSKDSSAYQKTQKSEEEVKEESSNSKDAKRKRKEKQKLKHEKQKEVDKLMDRYKDDPKFQEFLRVQQKSHTESWNNDAILKVGRDYHQDHEEEVEGEFEEAQKVANDSKLSDLEYLKSKGFNKEEKREEEKKIFFTVKLEGLPCDAKKKDVKKFIGPNMGVKSIRVPRNIKGIAYVGFATDKQREIALKKDKSFLANKQILVRKYDVDLKNAEFKSKQNHWKAQEDNLKDLDETIGQSGRLFIRNLSYAVTENDLEEIFKEFGPLAEINVPIDKVTKQVKGFAFVTYVIPENAVQAFTKLDGSTFQGRLLHIIPGKPPKTEDDENQDGAGALNFKQKKANKMKKEAGSSHNWNSLFLGASAVADLMSDKYNVSKEDVLLASNGGQTSAAVRLALGETQIVEETRQFLEAEGVKLEAFEAPGSKLKRSKTIILVKNLPAKTSIESVRNKFATYGQLQRIILPPNCVTALIEFMEPSEARTAFKSLAYINFNGNPLYLEWAPEDSISGAPTNPIAKIETSVKSEEMYENSAEKCTLFIKNLNFNTDEKTLESFIQDTLGSDDHGCLLNETTIARKKDVKNPGSMLSMGYGFITFRNSRYANEALKNMQHKVLDGHSVELKRSNRAETAASNATAEAEAKKSARKSTTEAGKVSSKLVVRNVPFEATKKEVEDIFSTFGQLKSVRLPKKVTGSHRGFAFVEFLTENEAKKAFDKLCHSTHLYGRRLVLEWASQEETLEELRKRTANQYVQGQPSSKRLKKSKLIESVQTVSTTANA